MSKLAKALMPKFGDNKGIQRVVEMLTHDITDLLRNSEKRLHKLSTRGPSEESNIRKNVQHSLATDLEFNLNGKMSRLDEDDELGGMLLCGFLGSSSVHVKGMVWVLDRFRGMVGTFLVDEKSAAFAIVAHHLYLQSVHSKHLSSESIHSKASYDARGSTVVTLPQSP